MPASQYQQYYLQSMGISLYAPREAQAEIAPVSTAEKPAVAPEPPKPQKRVVRPQVTPEPQAPSVAEPPLLVDKQRWLDSQIVADICRWLALTPADADTSIRNRFVLEGFTWQFAEGDKIGLAQGVLTSPVLSELGNSAAKRRLWAAIGELSQNG